MDQRTLLEQWIAAPAYQPHPLAVPQLEKLEGMTIAARNIFDSDIDVHRLLTNIEKFHHFIDEMSAARPDAGALRSFLEVAEPSI